MIDVTDVLDVLDVIDVIDTSYDMIYGKYAKTRDWEWIGTGRDDTSDNEFVR
jgi:hypothetical protein